MDGERISGTWKIVQSTDPLIRKGVDVRFAIIPDGLEVQVQGAAPYEIPWQFARVNVASNGQAVIESGRGTLWCDPGPSADPREFAQVFAATSARPERSTPYEEFPAGDGQILVLYRGMDDGGEVNPAPLLAAVAADAAVRAGEGWRLVSMVGLPLRHGGQVFGLQGGGATTKAAIGCLYARGAAPARESGR